MDDMPDLLRDLPPRRRLYLAALLTAQEARLKVAATRAVALDVLADLAAAGLIEVPWPALRWTSPPSIQLPLEGLAWRPSSALARTTRPLQATTAVLRGVFLEPSAIELGVSVWSKLVLAEAESYFAYQLGKHNFDVGWAADIHYVSVGLRTALSAAQWRYCSWVATRQGASTAAQLGSAEPDRVREAIFNDLGRRATAVATADWAHTAYAPKDPLPDNALARLFASDATNLHASFWSTVPSSAALTGDDP